MDVVELFLGCNLGVVEEEVEDLLRVLQGQIHYVQGVCDLKEKV